MSDIRANVEQRGHDSYDIVAIQWRFVGHVHIVAAAEAAAQDADQDVARRGSPSRRPRRPRRCGYGLAPSRSDRAASVG
jgi:hypothetical protein